MSTEESGSDKARGTPRGKGASALPELSALEQALRQALDAVPRDQVLKCIVSVLPATVFVEDSGRLHGGKVRKVSVSMPEELAEAVRARTGSGGFSRYVTDAVEERVRLNLLDELSEQLQAEFGPFDEEGVRQAMRLWTEEERYRSLVLDAEGLVKLATGDPKATLPFEAARRLKGHVVTSATTLIEVLRGDRSDARIYRVLSHVTVIPIDLNRARAAGELLGRTGLDGHRCALHALVATIALVQPGRVVVLTSDADDMAKLTEDPARSRKDRVRIVRV